MMLSYVQKGLVGWENIYDEDGNAVDFPGAKEAIEILLMSLLLEIQQELISQSNLDEKSGKN